MSAVVLDHGVKSSEAIAILRSKLRLPSKKWDQYKGHIHGRAFSVAGATKAALIKDFHESVIKALEEGQSLGQFRKSFDEIVQSHGWAYKGQRGWRSEIIYHTNMRSARMAGKWAQIQRNKKARPYLRYIVIDDDRLRDDHRKWREIILPVDHPFWLTHYPPNGWGCRCTVQQLSERDLKRMGLKVSSDPVFNKTSREVINKETGEVTYELVPEGIDRGWDHNVGEAWLGADKALGETLMNSYKPELRDALLDYNAKRFAAEQSKSWQQWLKTAEGQTRGRAHAVAIIGSNLIRAIEGKGIKPKSALIVVEDKQLNHLRGDHKKASNPSQLVPASIINELPKHMQDYQVALWDSAHDDLVLVFKETSGERAMRSVIKLNYSGGRGLKLLSTRSLSAIPAVDLKKPNFEVIEGSWEN